MKRKIKIVAFICALLACFGIFVGCSQEKTFEKSGMKITLTSAFYEKELVSLTAYYESRTSIVTALKQEFSLVGENYSLAQYTNIVLSNNNLTADVNEREGKDYQYFTFEKSVSGKKFYYLATTHKASDAFWLIQFACDVSDKDEFTNTFLGWADTVTFGSEEIL